jgi:hypothetical protein
VNRKSVKEQVQIIKHLLDGNSIWTTSKLTEASKNTVAKLLFDLGRASEQYQKQNLISLPCRNIQIKKTWSFKAKEPSNAREDNDIWTLVAVCSETKIVSSWFVGTLENNSWGKFIDELREQMSKPMRLANNNSSLVAIKDDEEGGFDVTVEKVKGDSFVPFSFNSQKVKNYYYAISLHFMCYNFSILNNSSKPTPAMAIGVTDHAWDLEEVVTLLNSKEWAE